MTPGTPILDPEGRAGIVLGPSGWSWLDTLVDFGGGAEAFAATSLRPDTADADRRPGDVLRLYEAGSRARGWPEGWRAARRIRDRAGRVPADREHSHAD